MAETFPWTIQKLHKRHDRAAFRCGVTELDDYLHRFAGQNEKAGISQHFIALPIDNPALIAGYYALSAGAVAFDTIPEPLRKRLPRYPIPVAHLGRLAVDRSAQGRGLGEHLLLDALARIHRVAEQIGIHAVEVLAINDAARSFYIRYGFTPLADDALHLYLPLSALRDLGL